MNESEKEVLEGDLGSVHNIVRLPIQEIYGTETVKQEPGEEQDVEKGTASGLKDENPQRNGARSIEYTEMTVVSIELSR